jgi:hypothetical protein
MKNKQNKTFWAAKTTKTGYSVTFETIQFGIQKVTHKFSVCEGKVLLGMLTWEEKNPNYVTPDVFETLISKNASMKYKFITKSEHVYQ